MATFVLVPGAWLGAWAWEPVADELARRGHAAHPLTLTGQAERAAEATPETGLGTHIADVVEALTSRDLRDVVLVGHSYGSAVVGAAAGQVPDRIAHLVYVSDPPNPDGMSIFDLMGVDAAGMMEGMASTAGDPDRLPFPARDVLDRFYGDHGFDDALYESVSARATPLPLGAFRERTPVGDPAAERIARTFVHARGDGPSTIDASAPGWEVVDLDTGHWPMLTAPDALADVLDRVGRRVDA